MDCSLGEYRNHSFGVLNFKNETEMAASFQTFERKESRDSIRHPSNDVTILPTAESNIGSWFTEEIFSWSGTLSLGSTRPIWAASAIIPIQISRELAKAGDTVHVWSPANESKVLPQDRVEVHAVPRGFGWRWLRELDRRLGSYTGRRNLLIRENHGSL